MLLDLQKKINKLLYHYYTIIGVAQRDIECDNLDETIEILIKELKETKDEIDKYLHNKINGVEEKKVTIEELEIEKQIKKTETFIENGKQFIDFLLDSIQMYII